MVILVSVNRELSLFFSSGRGHILNMMLMSMMMMMMMMMMMSVFLLLAGFK